MRPHIFNVRLANPVPIFERSWQIVLNEVDGSEEVVRVGILGIDSKRQAQVATGVSGMGMLERDACQLDGKSFVVRREPLSSEELRAGLVEAADLSQCGSVRVFEVGRLVRDRLDFADDFCPAQFGCELLEMLRLLRIYWLWGTGLSPTQRNKSQTKKEGRSDSCARRQAREQVARL